MTSAFKNAPCTINLAVRTKKKQKRTTGPSVNGITNANADLKPTGWISKKRHNDKAQQDDITDPKVANRIHSKAYKRALAVAKDAGEDEVVAKQKARKAGNDALAAARKAGSC